MTLLRSLLPALVMLACRQDDPDRPLKQERAQHPAREPPEESASPEQVDSSPKPKQPKQPDPFIADISTSDTRLQVISARTVPGPVGRPQRFDFEHNLLYLDRFRKGGASIQRLSLPFGSLESMTELEKVTVDDLWVLDDGLLVSASRYPRGYLLRLNAAGDISWKFELPDHGGEFMGVRDGHSYLDSDDGIRRISLQGEVTAGPTELNLASTGSLFASNGDLVVIGTYHGQTRLARLDAELNLRWNRPLHTLPTAEPGPLITVDDDHLCTAGSVTAQTPKAADRDPEAHDDDYPSDAWIMCFTPEGKRSWQARYHGNQHGSEEPRTESDHYLSFLEATEDGHLIAVGASNKAETWIFSTDLEGNVRWHLEVDTLRNHEAALDHDGHLWVAGNIGHGSKQTFWVGEFSFF